MLELAEVQVEEHEPALVGGVPLTSTVLPRSGEELAACVVELGEKSCPVVVRGGGSRMAAGNPSPGARAILSTVEIARVREFDEEDGVVLVEAGASVAGVAETAASAGWQLPLDPPGADSTIGGALASAATGPRVTGFGPVRDFVLGMEVVLGSGERTRCGGRVVKNVTGYDLAKLYVGSFGTLGIIESAWLRLRPSPECSEVRMRSHDDASHGCAAALRSARRISARSAALLSPRATRLVGLESGGAGEVVEISEFAGDSATVQRDAQGSGESAGPALIERLRDLQGEGLADSGIRARFSLLPSALESLWQVLEADPELALIAYPGAGLLYSIWRSDDPAGEGSRKRADEVVAALVDASRRHATGLFFEDLPHEQKRSQDVFVDAPALVLQRTLKQRFDPKGILNPGRFAGRI